MAYHSEDSSCGIGLAVDGYELIMSASTKSAVSSILSRFDDMQTVNRENFQG
jgi:hypothetical protein